MSSPPCSFMSSYRHLLQQLQRFVPLALHNYGEPTKVLLFEFFHNSKHTGDLRLPIDPTRLLQTYRQVTCILTADQSHQIALLPLGLLYSTPYALLWRSRLTLRSYPPLVSTSFLLRKKSIFIDYRDNESHKVFHFRPLDRNHYSISYTAVIALTFPQFYFIS